jgi:glycosyltransferase 2 family protein
MRRFVLRHKRLLLMGLGVGLLAWLVMRLGPSTIASALNQAGARIALLIVLYLAGTALVAFPWRWLLPAEARPGWAPLVASRLAAAAVNAIDPVFGVSGEPARLLWIRSPDWLPGTAGLIADRLLSSVAAALFLIATSAIVLAEEVVRPVYPMTALVLAAGWLAATLVFSRIVAGRGVVAPIARLVRRILRRPARDASPRQLEIDLRLRQLMMNGRALAVATALHSAGRIVLSAEVWVAVLILGYRLDLPMIIYLASIPSIIALVGAPVPGQLGVQEGGMVLACAVAGLDPRLGLAIVTLQRVRQVFSVALGGVILAVRRTAPAVQPPASDAG